MKRLRAFGSYVKLLWTDHISEYGHYNSDKHLISINTEHNLLTQQRTLAHELVHLIEDHYGLENLTEHQVDKLGTGWVTLLQENPQLVNYLTRKS